MSAQRRFAAIAPSRDVDDEIGAGALVEAIYAAGFPGGDRRLPDEARHGVGGTGIRQPPGIGRRQRRAEGEAADGDVIRMAVEAVWIQRADDRRAMTANQRDERL